MSYYLAFDGGGTKLQGILFDDTYRIISSARTDGVNINIYSTQKIKSNIDECVNLLFSNADRPITSIEKIFCSQWSEYLNVVKSHAVCDDLQAISEGVFGVLTCGLTSGICALAGTGSDVFYVKNANLIDIIGGWGYLLGDDGSGHFIGTQAIRAMIRFEEGVGKKTILSDLAYEFYGAKSKGDLMGIAYNNSFSPQLIASFCKITAMACDEGDEVAIDIMREAGEKIGRQVCSMIDKQQLLENEQIVCTTGSVFRFCKVMRERFEEYVLSNYPKSQIHHPFFEPVIGGVLSCMLEKGENITPQVIEHLKSSCKNFCI